MGLVVYIYLVSVGGSSPRVVAPVACIGTVAVPPCGCVTVGRVRWGGVEDAFEGRRYGGRRGDPIRLGRELAHASRVVCRSADRAEEDSPGFAGSIGGCDESYLTDGCDPICKGVLVLGGWGDVDVPGRVAFTFACADVLTFDEVKAADHCRGL